MAADQLALMFVASVARWTPLLIGVGLTPLQWLPLSIRLVLLLSFGVLSFPTHAALASFTKTYSTVFVIASEFLFGLLLMFQLNVLFAIFSFWGRLLDQQIGFAASGVMNPGSQETEPLLVSGFMLLAFTLFFTLGLHHHWLSLISTSYQWFPLGQVIQADWFLKVSLSFGAIFIASVSLFAPVVIALFLFDVVMAFVSRNMPQMNIYFVSMPLKIMLGMVVIHIVMNHFSPAYMHLNALALDVLRDSIR